MRDVLAVVGDDALRSTWTIRRVESVGGDEADALHRASDSGAVIDGHRLAELARNVVQIIDGEFSARLPSETETWITIRAVDSSWFDVCTKREEILMALKKRFEHVEDLPRLYARFHGRSRVIPDIPRLVRVGLAE